MEDLSRRLGLAPYSATPLRRLARLGLRLRPEQLADLLLRTGPSGDLFGLRRGGLSLRRLREHPHGLVLADEIATGVLADKLRTPGRRVRLAPPEIVSEVERLASSNGGDPRFPLRMIGMRELRSHNSWMHNAPLLMRGGRVQALRVHPDDAATHGLEDGGEARLESKDGAVTVPVSVSDEMTPGTVALPHGWGHRGGWRLAEQQSGREREPARGSGPDDLERLAGMAHLTASRCACRRLRPASRERRRRRSEDLLPAASAAVTVSAARTCRPRRFCLASALRSFEPKRSVSMPVAPAASVRGRELTL